MAVYLAVAGDAFDGVYLVRSYFSRDAWDEISGTEFSQFLRIFLPTLLYIFMYTGNYIFPLLLKGLQFLRTDRKLN